MTTPRITYTKPGTDPHRRTSITADDTISPGDTQTADLALSVVQHCRTQTATVAQVAKALKVPLSAVLLVASDLESAGLITVAAAPTDKTAGGGVR
ncbi:hypothetical protein GCM10027570_24940 [Streptomonospora sediminis]